MTLLRKMSVDEKSNDFGEEKPHSPKETSDFTFKVLMIGDSSVGKTATLSRFANDEFPHSFISTVGKCL